MWISNFFSPGTWTLFNPPGAKDKNYHFVKLNRLGKIYSPFALFGHMFFASSADNFAAYGEPLLAPENLKVLEVERNQRSRQYFNFFIDLIFRKKTGTPSDWGNYLRLENESGQQIILKHLKFDIPCQVGDWVKKGQFLAHVGSSGNCHVPGLGLSVEVKQGLDSIHLLNTKLRNGDQPDLYKPQQSKAFTNLWEMSQEKPQI